MQDLENELKNYPEGIQCPSDLVRRYCSVITEKYSRNCTESECPLFSNRYPTLFKMLNNSSIDLDILDLFLDRLEGVQEGKEELKEAEKDLASVLNERYVVPKLRETGSE